MSNHVSNPRGAVQALGFVWDVGLLEWVPETQPGGGGGGGDASAANQTTEIARLTSILAKQPALGTAGTASADVITVQGKAGMTAVKVDGSAVTQPVSIPDATKTSLLMASGSASSSGNNTVVTPTSGKKLRLSYIAYNPSAANECAFRFGAAGTLFLRNSLAVGGGVVAKDFGDLRYLEGAVDQALVLNLSVAAATIWNVFYSET